MQLLNKETHINFLGLRKPAMALSLLMIVIAIGSIAVRGFNFGIDFTGGTIIEVGYPQSAELEQIRGVLEEQGYSDAVVQHFGAATEVMIRIAPREGVTSAELSDRLFALLKADESAVELRRVEFVGPQVGEELTNDGGLAMIYALIGILIYVALRFEYRFAVGSVAALVHDVIITLGVFSLLQLDFDLTVLAAVLAVIGYSLNDTIVVFDRIRENFRKMRKGSSEEVVNASLNQTLSRTL
ncbi:MAG: protein translocase subunit SecF, partial [Gammaproteobacteria bacterium]|nr:protein translocase subunit SecF [Gammaproteobacteria bacterium]